MSWVALGVAAVGAVSNMISSNKQAGAIKDAARAYERRVDRASAYADKELDPYIQGGRSAYDQMLGLLGLSYQQDDYEAYVDNSPDILEAWKASGKSKEEFGREHYAANGEREGRTLPSTEYGGSGGVNQNALNSFFDSSGYRTQLQSGLDALDASYSSKGLRNSGARDKAVIQYGQGLGQKYFADYLGQLGGVVNAGQTAVQQNINTQMGAASQIGGVNFDAATTNAANQQQATNDSVGALL